MRDALDRIIEYLRLSVTEKCNLKCAYCSPEGTEPHHDFLSTYDIERVVRALSARCRISSAIHATEYE